MITKANAELLAMMVFALQEELQCQRGPSVRVRGAVSNGSGRLQHARRAVANDEHAVSLAGPTRD